MIAEQKIEPLTEPESGSSHGDYFEQIFQVPPVICGRQLKPLSIGRYRLMARFKVAFTAEDERVATAGDLLMGVLICSVSVEDFMILVAQPDFKQQIQKWGRQIGFFSPRYFGWPLIGKWLERFCGESFAESDFKYLNEQIAAFQEYIKEGSHVPEYWDESPESKASAAHWSQSIEVVLCGDLGWSELQINETPLGKAMWDYFKHMENQGLVRLMTPAEAVESITPLTPEEREESRLAAERVQEFLRSQNGGQNGQ